MRIKQDKIIKAKLIIQFKQQGNKYMSVQTEGYSSSLPHYRYEEDQNVSRSYNIQHYDYGHENKSQQVIPLTQKKSNTNSAKNQDDKSFTKNQLDLSQTFVLPKPTQKQPIVPKIHKSLFHEAMNRKVKSGRTQITVYYFNTSRRIVFPKVELSKKFAFDNRGDNKRELPLIKNLIPYLVKQYCKLFLNFEPLDVKHQYFQLKIGNYQNQEDPLVDQFSHDEEIIWLFDCGSLVLVRKQKDYERLKDWQDKIAADMQVLWIIIPSQKEIIQQVQKNRTLNSLKQKLTSHNQLGNIIIVTYNSFTVCEPKKKVADIVAIDRILEVYRLETSSYEDVETNLKKQKMDLPLTDEPKLYHQESRTIPDIQFQVNQTIYHGKLHLQIHGTKIIQKYEGGLLNFIRGNQRRIQRSVHTLVGMSCDKNNVKLKFLTKEGAEVCSYEFQSNSQISAFFRAIIKLSRELKQNFQKITD